MSMALTGLLAVLTMTPARADAKRPDGGPDSGVCSVLYDRSFDPGHYELPGMRLCRDGDRYWLLFTARTPDHNFSSGTFLDVLGIKCTLPWTWLAEVDLKGKLVGAARKVYPPSNAVYDVLVLGGSCLGCYARDGKLVCLNPDGAVVEVFTGPSDEKTAVRCRVAGWLDPNKLAAEFCDDARHVALQGLRADATGAPEIRLEIEREGGRRLFARRSFPDGLPLGLRVPDAAKVPACHYLGKFGEGKSSAVYDPGTDELSLVRPEPPFGAVWRARLMEKEHRDDLKKGIAEWNKLEWLVAGSGIGFSEKKPPKPGLPREVRPYGEIGQDDLIALGLSGWFQAVEAGGKAYGLYVEMREGKLLIRPFDDAGKPGKAVEAPAPSLARTMDYRAVVTGKDVIVFTAEREMKTELGGRDHPDVPWFYHTYRFDGAAWKKLPDWCKPATQRFDSPWYQPHSFDMIPVYLPAVLGDDVFVYYAAKRNSEDVPKVNRFHLSDPHGGAKSE